MFENDSLLGLKKQSEAHPIIQLADVGMHYDSGEEILSDLNLSINRGDFYFLTGVSGAGKTTLLKLLYLSHPPRRGHIKLFGHDVHYSDRKAMAKIRRRIGVVFQDYRLLDHLTVFENVALSLRIAGRTEKYIEKNVPSLLHWVGLGSQMHQKPPLLSGGQKQRVAIARAIVNKPDILFADEPTGNVDPRMAQRLIHLFSELNKYGTTVIVATHNTDLVNTFAFPRLHLEKGKLSTFDAGSIWTSIDSSPTDGGINV
ncbi:MAG: cell division ATP-binding protein FtsE [Alphaproteobacteria bacterium]